MSSHKSTGSLALEISRDTGAIKICAYTLSSGDTTTVRHYETNDIRDPEINRMCDSVVSLLNSANRQGKLGGKTLEELQAAGQLLYDSLLTNNVKKTLAETECETLLLTVDDHLIHIPWELLFDGNDFLCLRFNMGRLVRTSQKASHISIRKVKTPLTMLLVSDPRSDLEEAYKEGVYLRDELDNNLDLIEVNLRSSMVYTASLKGSLRDYDILHYAGHADYNRSAPSDSGFLMADGKLTVSDIMSMTGAAPLPALVFSNACKSGHTEPRRVGEEYESEIFSLANAFLLAGVQHYIGTFWDVQDEPSQYFALDFYKELIQGSMVGGAVRKARQGLIGRYGKDNIIWASYMMYGDPSVRYVDLLSNGGKDKNIPARERDETGKDEEPAFTASARGADTEIVFPRKRRKEMIIAAAAVLFIILIALYLTAVPSKDKPDDTTANISNPSGAQNERVDELVASLIRDYRERQRNGTVRTAPAVEQGVPTLVFLNIGVHGVSGADKDYIITGIANRLQRSGSVKVVEREILNKLLEELRMSSSELADGAHVLEIGKILSARIILTGSIARDGRDWQISLRLIDTETTDIRSALTLTFTAKKEDVAERVGNKLLDAINENTLGI